MSRAELGIGRVEWLLCNIANCRFAGSGVSKGFSPAKRFR